MIHSITRIKIMLLSSFLRKEVMGDTHWGGDVQGLFWFACGKIYREYALNQVSK
ncbi:MAG: hypothetical protein MRQ09_05700 [Candidatus Midichloria sp.]|nr:hypothetical protein [Candidatus Midichloria sp.]